MTDSNAINVFDLVGGICASSVDAQLIHDKIASSIRMDTDVVITFNRVDTIITAFLNVAIGQLYGEFEEEKIRRYLHVEGMGRDDLDLLVRVIENAKAYFKNKERNDKAWKEEVDGDQHS